MKDDIPIITDEKLKSTLDFVCNEIHLILLKSELNLSEVVSLLFQMMVDYVKQGAKTPQKDLKRLALWLIDEAKEAGEK